MSIQELDFQGTLQLLEFIKAVVTELVVSALGAVVCMVMYWVLVLQASQASGFFLWQVFPRCFKAAARKKKKEGRKIKERRETQKSEGSPLET